MMEEDATDIELRLGSLQPKDATMKTECEVLLVDDNPADIDLTREALRHCKRNFHVNSVGDGTEAISFLRQRGKFAQAPRPDLIVLDLNLPGKGGHDVLLELKCDPALFGIPVVVLTSSEAASDVSRSYELGANCYLREPGNLRDFIAAVQSMADFWLDRASLPEKEQ
jgi:two-component system, chemotaxis family, response regulator Rcp1